MRGRDVALALLLLLSLGMVGRECHALTWMFAGGSAQGPIRQMIMTNPRGEDTTSSVVGPLGSATLRTVAFGAGRWVGGGTGHLMGSVDGRTWSTLRPFINNGGRFSSVSVVRFSDGIFVASGTSVPFLPFAWSVDGLNFTASTIEPNGAVWNLTASTGAPTALLRTFDGSWLAGGGPAAPIVSQALSGSSTTWTAVAAQGYVLSRILGLAQANELGTVVAVGQGSALGISISDDGGNTWAPVAALDPLAAFPRLAGGVGRAVAYQSFLQRFYAVGASPVLCFSNDLGRSWRTVSFPSSAIRQASGIVFSPVANRLSMSVAVGAFGAWVTDRSGNTTSDWRPLSTNAIYYRANDVAADGLPFVIPSNITRQFTAPVTLAGEAQLAGTLVLNNGASFVMTGPVIISPESQLFFSSLSSGTFTVIRSITADIVGQFSTAIVTPACSTQRVLSSTTNYTRTSLSITLSVDSNCSDPLSLTSIFLIVFGACCIIALLLVLWLVLCPGLCRRRHQADQGYEVVDAIPRESQFKASNLSRTTTEAAYSPAYESLVMYDKAK